jgi:two-component system, cell cycle response regulator
LCAPQLPFAMPSSTPVTPAPRYAVALQGFSEFERAALASFFRLAARRSPTYVQVGAVDHGDFLIADADHPGALDAVLDAGRELDTVFVGATAPAGAMAWLPRPIDPIHIVRELDALVEQRVSGRAPVADAPRGAGMDLLLPDLDTPVRARREPIHGAHAAHYQPAVGGRGRDVLVVDDSAIARKFLQLRLQRLGYRVHLARNGELALDMLEAMPFSVLFLDIGLGDADSLDGLQLCQLVRQRATANGEHEPAIVMVTGSASAADRVRGSLAGCDAYLTKPLAEITFLQALRQVDPGFDPVSESMLG